MGHHEAALICQLSRMAQRHVGRQGLRKQATWKQPRAALDVHKAAAADISQESAHATDSDADPDEGAAPRSSERRAAPGRVQGGTVASQQQHAAALSVAREAAAPTGMKDAMASNALQGTAMAGSTVAGSAVTDAKTGPEVWTQTTQT
jgi:hypothetical protein